MREYLSRSFENFKSSPPTKKSQLFGKEVDLEIPQPDFSGLASAHLNLVGPQPPANEWSMMMPGAWKRTLKENFSLPLLYGHQSDALPLGLFEARETTKGLEIEGFLSNTQSGNDVRELINDGALNALSIGFDVREKNFAPYGVPGSPGYLKRVRYITDADLAEVSIVLWPADSRAKISRSPSAGYTARSNQNRIDAIQQRLNNIRIQHIRTMAKIVNA